jgi:hypothetical protein
MKVSTRMIGVTAALITVQTANAMETAQDVVPKSAGPAVTSIQPAPSQLLSLEFARNSPVASVLQLIAKQTNSTLLLGQNVTDKLTTPILLQDTTPEQALTLIAKLTNLAFRKIDDSTFAIGNVDDDTITRSQAKTVAAVQAEELKPSVTMSRIVKLTIEVRNMEARDVLQQIADKNGLLLIFPDLPKHIITNLDVVNLSPEAAIIFIAEQVGWSAIRITTTGNKKRDTVFLLRNKKAVAPQHDYEPRYEPRTRILPPYLRFDTPPRETKNLEETDPMVVKPPQDRKFHGLMPRPENALSPESNEKSAPQ